MNAHCRDNMTEINAVSRQWGQEASGQRPGYHSCRLSLILSFRIEVRPCDDGGSLHRKYESAVEAMVLYRLAEHATKRPISRLNLVLCSVAPQVRWHSRGIK